MKPRVGVLCSRVRLEEKLLLAALADRDVQGERLDVQAMALDLPSGLAGYDLILVRCLSHWRALYASKVLAAGGQRILNTHEVIATCGDGLLTSLALSQSGVPTPPTKVAFFPQAGLEAIEQMGYPVTLVPAQGSPAELRVIINDREAAETILEHRTTLGGEQQSIFCLQRVDGRRGRLLSVLVVGEEVVAAVHRQAPSRVANGASGNTPLAIPVTSEIERVSRAAAGAVGGGVLAVDVLEGADGRLLVTGVQHTPEFREFSASGGRDIATVIADHCLHLIGTEAAE